MRRIMLCLVFVFTGLLLGALGPLFYERGQYDIKQEAVEKGHARYYTIGNREKFVWYKKGDTTPEVDIRRIIGD